MPTSPQSHRSAFVFTLCQAGAEQALKREIQRNHPNLRFAYSRPGFVTFKYSAKNGDASDLGADFELNSIFARAYGLSLTKTPADNLGPVLDLARQLAPAGDRKLRLHVAERESFEPGEEPRDHEPDARAQALRTRLLWEAPKLFESELQAQTGELVLDVLVIEENELWLGVHLHGGNHSPWPGGKPEIFLPPQAPSRAYLKLEEAALWSGAALKKGQVAIEIGSAPGGASLALLNRGLEVYGIDRAEMNPVVFHNPAFHRVGTSVFEVLRSDFPENVHWILMDMNAAPDVSLQAIEGLAPWFEDSLQGMILTLKLNHWNLAEGIPKHLERIRKIGLWDRDATSPSFIMRVRARQLAHNRREYTVFALTKKAMMRRKES